jgi:putative effector of murein hydrolase
METFMNNETVIKIYNAIFNTPVFSLCICVLAYQAALLLQRKFKLLILNPLLTSSAFIIAFLLLAHIPYAHFKKGGDILLLFLGPATEVLALAIYNQRSVLRKNFVPVIAGTVAGAITSVSSIYLLGKAFHLDTALIHSLLPKSVTTPIGLSLSKSIGGIEAVTVFAIIITGISGGMAAPYLIRLFRVKSDVVGGIALGTCSHVVGTAAALELGEVYGAMSSVAIGCAGIATTIIFVFL